MPHQCTDCSRVFDDGSKEMLSGCPDCGGTTFQYLPAGEAGPANDGGEGAPAPDANGRSPGEVPSGPPDPPGSSVAQTVGKTAATVRSFLGSADGPDPAGASGTDDGASSAPARDGGDVRAPGPGSSDDVAEEDHAQASARRDVVSPDELPVGAGTPTSSDSRAPQAPGAGPESSVGESVPEQSVEGAGPDPSVGGASPDPSVGGSGTTPSIDGSGPEPSGGEARTERAAGGSEQGQAAGGSEQGRAAGGSNPDRAGHDRESHAGRAESPDVEDRPDLSELRAELNEQFESIRVVNPGQYELNLMELYDRDEYIVALREDGRYSIQVPESYGT